MNQICFVGKILKVKSCFLCLYCQIENYKCFRILCHQTGVNDVTSATTQAITVLSCWGRGNSTIKVSNSVPKRFYLQSLNHIEMMFVFINYILILLVFLVLLLLSILF